MINEPEFGAFYEFKAGGTWTGVCREFNIYNQAYVLEIAVGNYFFVYRSDFIKEAERPENCKIVPQSEYKTVFKKEGRRK